MEKSFRNKIIIIIVVVVVVVVVVFIINTGYTIPNLVAPTPVSIIVVITTAIIVIIIVNISVTMRGCIIMVIDTRNGIPFPVNIPLVLKMANIIRTCSHT